jgi:hypothetical protein
MGHVMARRARRGRTLVAKEPETAFAANLDPFVEMGIGTRRHHGRGTAGVSRNRVIENNRQMVVGVTFADFRTGPAGFE